MIRTGRSSQLITGHMTVSASCAGRKSASIGRVDWSSRGKALFWLFERFLTVTRSREYHNFVIGGLVSKPHGCRMRAARKRKFLCRLHTGKHEAITKTEREE